MSVVFYYFHVMKCLFLKKKKKLTKWPKCKKIPIYVVVDKKTMRANNENERRSDWKFSQLSIKLILNLTEQLSMHSFHLEKWKVVQSLACPRTVERTTVCTEQKYFLFYLFYFIKVYTDFISWGK